MNNLEANYLKTLEEYIQEQLFITDDVTMLEKELDRNYWWIGGSPEQISSLTAAEWIAFFDRLIEDRQNQLNNPPVDTDLIFYCYYDKMAGQIRFNVITSRHPQLPFGYTYREVPLEAILKAFTEDQAPGLIPTEELKIIPLEEEHLLEEEPKEPFVLNVFVCKLVKRLRQAGTPLVSQT